VVSEPLEADEDGWEAIPPGSWAEIGAGGAAISPFRPVLAALAA
jgi:predicted glutamine amidotransferase